MNSAVNKQKENRDTMLEGTTDISQNIDNPLYAQVTRLPASEVTPIITRHLNPKFPLRPYQKEAFTLFQAFYENEFDGKPSRPYHLNFNMATGSGKTLIMAGLMLYLFEKGYRRFIFLVNSTNIIEKTKDNFLNFASSKYLFDDKIHGKNANFTVKHVGNLHEADEENINILFTTVQKLHADLTIPKENGLMPEDFDRQKIVFIADEAHHINATTRQGKDAKEESWENTVMRIFRRRDDNLLLEFSATMDLNHAGIREKYADKIIFSYDLKQFRLAGYSKEINLLVSNATPRERILQALILHEYRARTAKKHGIPLKPVILFKAHRTIAESNRNKAFFHRLIGTLTTEDLRQIHVKTQEKVLQKAFDFFEKNGIDYATLKSIIQADFQPGNCLSANNDKEKEKNQLILNSLEDENNPIRAVFAVQKLNEGWDVLNLFDIVRLYDNPSKKTDKLHKTTVSEAQLIGRGARYFPFTANGQQNFFTRKYDKDLAHELRILEELYYHTIEDNHFVEELKKTLVRTGIYEDERNFVERRLELKEAFVNTDFYRKGFIVQNKKIARDYTDMQSFSAYKIPQAATVISLEDTEKSTLIPIKTIQKHVVRRALADIPFFRFAHLRKYFPALTGITEFIEKDDYLRGVTLTVKTTLKTFTNEDKHRLVKTYLRQVEKAILRKATAYTGSKEFELHPVATVFQHKTIKVPQKNILAKADEKAVTDKEYYVHRQFYGSDLQREYILQFTKSHALFKRYFDEVYLILNEGSTKFHVFDGDETIIPDFVLILRRKKEVIETSQFYVSLAEMPENAVEKSLEQLTAMASGTKRDITVVINNYTDDNRCVERYTAFFPAKK